MAHYRIITDPVRSFSTFAWAHTLLKAEALRITLEQVTGLQWQILKVND